jgi:Chlorophyll A-B binding protein
MKLSTALILASIAGTSAFTSSGLQKKTLALRMVDSEPTVGGEESAEATPSFEAPKPKQTLPKMSEALPFLLRPAALDGSMVGDVGFDPFGFAKSKEDLMNYREAEIKHARLAMLVSFRYEGRDETMRTNYLSNSYFCCYFLNRLLLDGLSPNSLTAKSRTLLGRLPLSTPLTVLHQF